MTTDRELFQSNLARAKATRDQMLDELRAALTDRDGWHEWEQTWSHVERGEGHLPQTHREIRPARGHGPDWMTPVFDLWCVKKDGRGQACDEARFTVVAEAVAWIEQPRSETTLFQRAQQENDRRWERRNRVNIASLVGERVDAGRNGKGQWFRVVEFEGIGRVRITDLGIRRFRVVLARRSRVVTLGEGQGPGVAVRAAIEELYREVIVTGPAREG